MNLANAMSMHQAFVENELKPLTKFILAGGPGSGRHKEIDTETSKLYEKHDFLYNHKARVREDQRSAEFFHDELETLHSRIDSFADKYNLQNIEGKEGEPATVKETLELAKKDIKIAENLIYSKEDYGRGISSLDNALSWLHETLDTINDNHGDPRKRGNIKAGGPGSGRRKEGGKKEKDAGRQARALSSYVPSTMANQHQATKNEKALAKVLPGSVHMGDHAPFDLLIPSKRIGIEVKTKIDGKKDTITMHPSSRQRKLDAAKTMKLKNIFTVIFDDRHGIIYYAKGVGSYKWKHGREHSTIKQVYLANMSKVIK